MSRSFALAAALALAGCGSGAANAGSSPACSDVPQTVERALRAAPGRVVLADGSALSACIARARDDGQLQTVGSVFSTVADDLASRAPGDRAAALQLGYLVGAARRGARHVNGVAAELVRRLEQAAAGAPVEALAPGLRAGELDG